MSPLGDMEICGRYGSTVNCLCARGDRLSLMVFTSEQKTALEADRKDSLYRLYVRLSTGVPFPWSHVLAAMSSRLSPRMTDN